MQHQQLLRLLRPLLYRRGKHQKFVWLLVGLVLIWGLLAPYFGKDLATTVEQGDRAILQAFENRRSDVWVQANARVIKNLPDDEQGSRHQKMILELLSTNHTLLLSHNIDLAPRVPAREGDTLRFCGEYEFSEKGGVIHWTHHDPAGGHTPGWIEYQGKRYE